MSKPAERNVHNADTPDFSVPDDGHGTPTSNTIGILLDACQTAKRITEALLPRSPAPRTKVLARARRETVPSFRHVPPHDFPLRRNAVPDDQDPSSPVSVAMGSITRAGRKEHHGRIIHHIRAHEHAPPEFGIDAATVQWLTTGYMLLLVAIGLASLIMAVSFFSEWNGDWLVWALLVVCVAALAVFARMQLKIIHPLTGIFRRLPPWPMHLYPSNGLPPS